MTEAAKIEAELEERLGDVIAKRYRLDELLGVGGMGAVYRAHHLLLKQDVAVKVLHPDLASNEELAKRFDREGQSAARLEHPNVIDIKDVGTSDTGMKYMVMPVLEGEELIARLGKPMPPSLALELIDQILAGLEHAHSRGVIHRDLKPENVFVTEDHAGREVLKLVDFGIAKMLGDAPTDEDSAPLTKLGLVFGTPQYMSPEQATGVPIDARTDLYSAGIILFEMLTGKPPFENADPVALVRMQVTVEPPSLANLVSPAVASLVARMLVKERDDRFSSATEVRRAVNEAYTELGGAGVPGEIPTLDDRTPVTAVHAAPPTVSGPTTTAVEIVPSSATSSIVERIKEQPPKRILPFAAGAVLLLGLLTWAVWPSDDEPKIASTGTTGAPIDDAAADVPEPNEEQVDEIRKALLAKDPDEALALIKPLRDEFPENAQLLWFEGHALSLKKGKQSLALARYADALEQDPELMKSQDFYAEMYDLLGQRKLRDEAVDIALQRMGPHGHKFLLERLNDEDPKRALSYVDRHRALEELAKAPQSYELVNHDINLARDLWQSKTSPQPCLAFSIALDDVAKEPNEYFLTPIRRAKVPDPKEGAEDEAICPTLEAKLEVVRQQYELLFGEAAVGAVAGEAAPAEAPSKPVRPESEGGSAEGNQGSGTQGSGKKSSNKKSSNKKKKKKGKNPFKELGDALKGG